MHAAQGMKISIKTIWFSSSLFPFEKNHNGYILIYLNYAIILFRQDQSENTSMSWESCERNTREILLDIISSAPDFWGRGPGFGAGISYNDPDALQDQCVIM